MNTTVLASLVLVGGVLNAHAIEPATPASEGRSAGARVRVAIVIPRVFAMRLADHPATVDITPEDIASGEIVVRGVRARIIANGREGYRLRAELSAFPFAEVEIDGFDTPVRAQPGVTTIEMRANGEHPHGESRALEYRLKISRNARPGRYRWPIALSVLDP